MPAIYSEADESIYELMNSVLADHFSVVANLDPTLKIQIRMASDPKGGCGVKCHGHGCAAKIKIVKAEERTTWNHDDLPNFPDLRLFIDKDLWNGLEPEEKNALLFHELNHIVPVRDKKTGSLRLDEYGRVKLRLRLDDWMLTGFLAACEIFGENALEYQALVKVRKGLTQLNLPFGDKPKRAKLAKQESSDSGEAA